MALFWSGFLPTAFAGAAAQPNPISKVYVAAVEGDDAFVRIGDRSQPIAPKETYRTEGASFETGFGTTVKLVFSNGIAVELRGDTRLEVRRFAQEPFRPSRADIAVEPSISKVELVLAHGTAVLATGTLAPGSQLELQTHRAVLNIQGGTMVVSASTEMTDVAVASGSCSVYGRNDTNRFQAVKAGEQAAVRSAPDSSSPDSVVIAVSRMTAPVLQTTTQQIADTALVVRTVYFEAKATTTVFNSVTAFDAPPASGGSSPTSSSSQASGVDLEAVAVVPKQPPVQFTISPAALLPTTNP